MASRFLLLVAVALGVGVGAGLAQVNVAGRLVTAFASFLPDIFNAQRARVSDRGDHSDRTEFDFVIVGAGASGSALAARLTENPDWHVLLLEAGGEEVEVMTVPFLLGQFYSTDANWQYVTTPQNTSCAFLEGSRCDYPQGRLVGGSTGINYMFNIRGNPRDFDNWAAMGNEGWSWSDIFPYFKKIERMKIKKLQKSPYHGFDGPVVTTYPVYESGVARLLQRAGEELGLSTFDYNGEVQEGVHRIQTTTDNGVRWSANKAYLDRARTRPNLYVRSRSLVTRVLFDDAGRALGVRYRRAGREVEVRAAREVILSAGAVNSPALLLRSGVGPRQHLESLGIPVVQDLPVGHNLQDHTGISALFVTFNQTLAPSVNEIMLNPMTHLDYFLHKRGPLTLTGTFEVVSFSDLKGTPYHSPGWPQVEVLHSSVLPLTDFESARVFRITKEMYDAILRPLEGRPVYQASIWPVRPKSRGRVFLKDADPDTPPEIDPNGLSHPDDIEVTLAGIREFQQMLRTPSFQRVGAQQVGWDAPGCRHLERDSDTFWRCLIRGYSLTIYHPTGTCKMAPAGDPTAVVTPDLRVKGLRGLRVVDSSVPPTLVSGHLQMTSYVIGEKAADMIKSEYLSNFLK